LQPEQGGGSREWPFTSAELSQEEEGVGCTAFRIRRRIGRGFLSGDEWGTRSFTECEEGLHPAAGKETFDPRRRCFHHQRTRESLQGWNSIEKHRTT
jgi:hypothetical protein